MVTKTNSNLKVSIEYNACLAGWANQLIRQFESNTHRPLSCVHPCKLLMSKTIQLTRYNNKCCT